MFKKKHGRESNPTNNQSDGARHVARVCFLEKQIVFFFNYYIIFFLKQNKKTKQHFIVGVYDFGISSWLEKRACNCIAGSSTWHPSLSLSLSPWYSALIFLWSCVRVRVLVSLKPIHCTRVRWWGWSTSPSKWSLPHEHDCVVTAPPHSTK